jgi:hypothetical protein
VRLVFAATGSLGVVGVAKQNGVMGVGYDGKSGCGVFGANPEGGSSGEGGIGEQPGFYVPKKHLKEPGAGVYGWSDAGYGGVFSSERRAQIHLFINPETKEVPENGKAGDLIAILAEGFSPDKDTPDRVPELWSVYKMAILKRLLGGHRFSWANQRRLNK